jgi:hypothetical protein
MKKLDTIVTIPKNSTCMISFRAGQNKGKGRDGKHGGRPGSILLAGGEAA